MTSPGTQSSGSLPALLLAPEPAAPLESAVTAEPLLNRLARVLELGGIRYCQWKGQWSAHRWATGHGDVDLLVDRDAITQFRTIIGQLGFKAAYPAGYRRIPGVESYFGHDPLVPRLLHLHVHYRLVLGDYWRPIYRIPIESPMLDCTVRGQPFRAPSPTYQFLVFVLRLMLRQVGRPLLSAQTRWTSGVEIQLASLEAGSDRDQLADILARHLPTLDLALFDRCVRSLQGGCGPLERAVLPWQLHQRLRSHARRPEVAAVVSAALERILPGSVARTISPDQVHLAAGGAVVALLGGDGSGKTTCARELARWLAPVFLTMRAHLGNPPRSVLTLLVGGLLKLQHGLERLLKHTAAPASYLELCRYACTARDRFRLYRRIHRFAARGGVAICERYPVEQNRLLVGPCIPGLLRGKPDKLRAWLRQKEASYYNHMLGPDVLCVLRLDPDLAVARKPEEPADYVRARGRVIWETDWTSTGAHLVDASQPLPDVVLRLKSIVWSTL
jgi:thymidylate kinase